jgi:hypothetical protein
MNNSKLSYFSSLKIIGCLIFDIGLILAYFKVFSLFILIFTVKSILILFILIIGLMIFNGAVIFPNMLFKSIGIPYSASIVTLLVLYAIGANILSIFLIPGSLLWYIVWELIIFAVFLVIFSIIAVFSKGAAEEVVKVEREEVEKTSILLQLLEIEDILTVKEEEAILPILNLFKTLKERIQVSTPFGRINGNNAVLQVENQIKNNLVSLQVILKGDLTDKNLIQLQKLIEDTRILVINREILNIK